MSVKLSQPEKTLFFRGYELDLSKKTHLMGVLNITPDSFSDGGLFFDKDSAIERGIKIEKEGADIIDIGGESTRPGSVSVSVDEELRRVIPVVETLAPRVSCPISIDTNKPRVAEEAIKAGASLINNVMGTDLDRRMAAVAAKSGAPIILMHIKGKPRTMQDSPIYEDLVGEIISDLKNSIAIAEDCGVDPKKIIIDPGIGFGKTLQHNLEILKKLEAFTVLGKPILVGPSRKSFIGAVLDIKMPNKCLMGTAAAAAIAIINGADIIRVHDIKEMVQVSKLTDAVWKR